MPTFPVTLDAVNRMDKDAFVAAFGDIAEHSAWVAAAAERERPFADLTAMKSAFLDAVLEAEETQKLSLVRAHPDLAGRAKLAELAPESQREQSGAGLDKLTAEELDRFTMLNDAYRTAFEFPFIFAVKGATKHQILEAFEKRLLNDPEQELATAIRQVGNIISFRLDDRVRP